MGLRITQGKLVKRRTGHAQSSQEEIEILNDIGFIWKPREYLFNLVYEELIEFKNNFRHLDVKNTYISPSGFKLGSCCLKRRTGHAKATKKEKKLLNETGFIWIKKDNRLVD